MIEEWAFCISAQLVFLPIPLGLKYNLQTYLEFGFITLSWVMGRNQISYSCSYKFFRNPEGMYCFKECSCLVLQFRFWLVFFTYGIIFLRKDGDGWGCIVLLRRKKWSSSLDEPSLQWEIRWIGNEDRCVPYRVQSRWDGAVILGLYSVNEDL